MQESQVCRSSVRRREPRGNQARVERRRRHDTGELGQTMSVGVW